MNARVAIGLLAPGLLAGAVPLDAQPCDYPGEYHHPGGGAPECSGAPGDPPGCLCPAEIAQGCEVPICAPEGFCQPANLCDFFAAHFPSEFEVFFGLPAGCAWTSACCSDPGVSCPACDDKGAVQAECCNDLGWCAACLADDHCPAGLACVEGQCQPPGAGCPSPPPAVQAISGTRLRVVPQPFGGDPEPVALRMTSPSFPCVDHYIQPDGTLGAVARFLLPGEWGAVDARGPEIAPSANDANGGQLRWYRVEAECESGGASEPASRATARWGDLNLDGAVDIFDIFQSLDGFAGELAGDDFLATDIAPCGGDDWIDIFDIFYVLNAFEGRDYPCFLPCGGACCDGATCALTPAAECAGTYLGDGTGCTPNPCGQGPSSLPSASVKVEVRSAEPGRSVDVYVDTPLPVRVYVLEPSRPVAAAWIDARKAPPGQTAWRPLPGGCLVAAVLAPPAPIPGKPAPVYVGSFTPRPGGAPVSLAATLIDTAGRLVETSPIRLAAGGGPAEK